MNDMPKKKKNTFFYIIIVILLAALILVGTLTSLSMYQLAAVQKDILGLQQEVVNITETSETLISKAEELTRLQNESATDQHPEPAGPNLSVITPSPEISAEIPVETPTPLPQQPAENTQNEGMISPSKDSEGTFAASNDDSMNQLLAQIQNLLPTNNGRWSVYVCNLTKGAEGVINDTPMQAASLIKLFIMGAVYENYDSLIQQYGASSVNNALSAMITVSDNDSANTLVSYLGGGNTDVGMSVVNAFCKAHGYYSTSMGRLLLQSNANGDNYTSVSDCGKFLKEIYQINNGTAVSASLSHAGDMYNLLKNQQRRHKIPAQIPQGVGVANKTGELSNVENDAAIIYNTAKGIDLVICFMSENLSATGSAQESIASYSRMIYGYYNE